jgi:hypothetical protein
MMAIRFLHILPALVQIATVLGTELFDTTYTVGEFGVPSDLLYV